MNVEEHPTSQLLSIIEAIEKGKYPTPIHKIRIEEELSRRTILGCILVWNEKEVKLKRKL